MSRLKTKNIISSVIICAALIGYWSLGFAADFSSTSFVVKSPVISSGFKSASSANFGLGQSLTQTAIGKSTSANFQLWSGFQYYYLVKQNTLTATAGNGQVSLSWTVPATYLGIAAGDYEVGVGTVSGSYVFVDVGNVTSYTKTDLTNGNTYYFKIKAKTSAGTFLVFSNEASAAPAAPSTPPSTGGGGGGGGAAYVTPVASGNAVVIFKGLAYPGADVTVLKDGAVAATTIADSQANFQVQIANLATGIYSFSVYAEDTAGRKSTTVNFIQSLTSGVTTTADNIFLAPTIAVDHSIIKKGDTLGILGYSAPAAQVNVFVNSTQEYVEKVSAGTNGGWFKAFDTSFLDMGDHTTRSKAVKGELISVFSSAVPFKVGDKSVEAPQTACGRSDLNCDGRVNITDFSILLYFWKKTNPSNQKADINGDSVVNLTDLSIMLYDWTG
jgi:hypothetical protein